MKNFLAPLANWRQWLPTASIGLAIIFLSSALYFQRENMALKITPQQELERANQKVIAQLSELMALPQDEMPTVATITSLENLRGRQFFQHAKLGDKVIVYTNARKAILFDQLNHKIIEVAPLNIAVSPSPESKPN